MNDPDLAALLRSPALDLPVDPATADVVRERALGERRQRRKTASSAVLVAVVVGIVVGPGVPDRLLPPDRRGPVAQAALLPFDEPPAQEFFRVRYAPGAYHSATTEPAVAACAQSLQAYVTLSFDAGKPAHRVAAEGSDASVAALAACLRRIPGALVTTETGPPSR